MRTPKRRADSLRRNVRAIISVLWHSANRFAMQHFPLGRMARYYRQRTFRLVYEGRRWGYEGDSKYCSGVGSTGAGARAYVESMVPILAGIAGDSKGETTIVDLGCGDFKVGAELLNRLPGVHYIGCDIVPGLIEDNRRRFGSTRVEFRRLDIVSEDLPEGEVYLVRQVFQHLPNLDIAKILTKLVSCPHVFVTEGQPCVREGPVNPDKNIGGEVRFDWKTGIGRGVELDQPPFNMLVEEICRVVRDATFSREVIVTWRLAAGPQSASKGKAFSPKASG